MRIRHRAINLILFLLLAFPASAAQDIIEAPEEGKPVAVESVNEEIRKVYVDVGTNTSNITTNTTNITTNTASIAVNTAGIASVVGIKAWVKFDGTAVTGANDLAGVDDSYNVSGVVDNGTGDYTIYWDTDFSDADYCVSGIADNVKTVGVEAMAAGTLTVNIYDVGVSKVDSNIVCIMALGDQ